MKKYYYSFGTAKQYPFSRGWVEIVAPDITAACRLFRAYFPDVNKGILNCADYYTEEEWNETGMGNGSWGECHGVYTYGA